MERKIWKAEELEKLSPEEQDRIFDESIIWNLDDAPPALVAGAVAFVEQRIQQEPHHAD